MNQDAWTHKGHVLGYASHDLTMLLMPARILKDGASIRVEYLNAKLHSECFQLVRPHYMAELRDINGRAYMRPLSIYVEQE